MAQNRIIVLITAACMIIDVIYFLIRAKKNGVNKNSHSRKTIIGAGVIYLLAVCLLVINWFREYGLIQNCILGACTVLCIEIENRQLLGIQDDDDHYHG